MGATAAMQFPVTVTISGWSHGFPTLTAGKGRVWFIRLVTSRRVCCCTTPETDNVGVDCTESIFNLCFSGARTRGSPSWQNYILIRMLWFFLQKLYDFPGSPPAHVIHHHTAIIGYGVSVDLCFLIPRQFDCPWSSDWTSINNTIDFNS